MLAKTPVALAESLGLQTLTTHSPDGRWTTIKFVMPPMESPSYFATVSRVTQWRETTKPWTLRGPDLRMFVVASSLTFGTRLRTAFLNLKTRKARHARAKAHAEYLSDAAVARRRDAAQVRP